MKNVHTEHCCERHGCKYNEKDCPVEFGGVKQSFPCEVCQMEFDEGRSYVYKIRFKETGKYKSKRNTQWNETGEAYNTIGTATGALKNCMHRLNRHRNQKYSLDDFEIVEFAVTEHRIIEL
jgi:hypothetical protein